MKNWIAISLLLPILIGCSTTKTSMLIGDTYDKEKDETSLILMPYGNINIPGKWTKTQYNEVSRQHFFINQDSVSIAVTKNPQNKYPFYESDMNEKQFIDKFFDWEKGYYQKQGYALTKLNEESEVNYIIWTASGKDANTIFLFGAKDKFCYNFSIFKSMWNEETKIEFLKSLFERN